MVNQAENENSSEHGNKAGDEFMVEHIPVLADTLTEQVVVPKDGTVVDATIGQGGHSLLFGEQLGSEGTLIGFDVDQNALSRSSQRLKALPCRVILIHSNFYVECFLAWFTLNYNALRVFRFVPIIRGDQMTLMPFKHECPTSIEEAIALLEQFKEDSTSIAGGTDLLGSLKDYPFYISKTTRMRMVA